MKKYIIIIASIVALALVGGYFYSTTTRQESVGAYPTYFSYTEDELNSIGNSKSKQVISTDDVYFWDQVAFDLMAKNTPTATFQEEPSKVYAYLAVAQRDFYTLSYNTSGKNSGTFDHLSKEVLCLFFKQDCKTIITRGEKDEYSTVIGELVIKKIRERIALDTSRLTPYPIAVGEQYWAGDSTPKIGITNGNSLGWFIESGDQFRAAPPPAYDSKEFKEELRMTQEALHNATKEQREAVVSWAGVPGTKTPPGQLLQLGDVYMQEHQVPLEKVLLVRSVVALAIADAVTAVFDSKYTYLVRRPFMMDPTLITIMPTPNHPSYPSGHSTLSKAAVTVLKHYFPLDTVYWDTQAHEAGMSRVWGGIHYIMDHTSAVPIGEQVGQIAIEKTGSI